MGEREADMARGKRFFGLVAGIVVAICGVCAAQAPVKYEATIESLDKHPLPEWYAGAKLGIFIHWGL